MLPSVLLLAALAAPPVAIDVGDRKQLFIDDALIARRDRVELRVNPPQKLGPLKDDSGKPLRGHVARVIDGEKARLYLGHENVQVLESTDGLAFRRTGTKLPGGHFPTIFLDPHETDAAKRYKLFHLEFSEPFDPAKHGVFASYSPDGVKFTKVGRVLPFFTDNPTVVHWDERIRKYVIYTRAFDYTSENQRRIGRIETDDPLKPWPYTKTEKHRIFPSVENLPVVYSADKEDDPHSDVYYNAAEPYPWAGGVYLMFPSHFRHFSPQRHPFVRPRVKGQWEDYGMLEVQLAVSRDGVKWSRPERTAYIPTGLADEWDRWYTVAAPGFVRRGNYVYQYYYSSGRLHDSAVLRPEYDKIAGQEGGVGVVRQRLDGFVSADADHKGGWLTTPPLIFRGSKLRLNIDTGAAGNAFVELQDADGKPIPGFTLAECEEIGGNFVDQCVYWKGKEDVSALAGRPVCIHVRMKRSKLFAFQFTKE
ncbi:hypothetical protein GobsT_39100 [Gemmata obscuriglobus]|uniref:Uncharacterized protein n=1 Tax=Gemmata obscuriglobus TaxID=114 RepID=A0A2Z3GW95_9BACT|nr:hypothetical protein [Gemmata obscuriglobus]AWM38013.1 hypothetical protein C1280_14105 [Gemmata obscuriglobus]QEG29121.1 hypothetical protein GobsT_39100 [Gemmata obscuriglobus]VTS07817.1 Uncharacterized protein OS=Chthoniobacter flavus Ellin428 GN=CfE428DRAFT_3508 PE=4 SV=1 [Gemmata obscuriglobus UQM 2246]